MLAVANQARLATDSGVAVHWPRMISTRNATGPDTGDHAPDQGARPHRLSRTIAFMNQKGGVGKTTTVVNLAAAVARAGRSVLVIDLDPQAHATIHLGVDPDSGPSVYDLLLPDDAERSAGDPVIHDVRDNLGLIPSTTDLAAAESQLAGEPDRLNRLTAAIEPLKRSYEFIFMDCPPSLGLLTLNALVAAREVIVPMQAHFLALQGTGKLLETVTHVAADVNPRLRVTGVVLCMHEDQTRHAREVVDDIRGFFKQQREQDVPWASARVYPTPIRRNIKLAECPSFGQTIFEYAPGAPGAKDYEALAGHVIDEWDSAVAKIDAAAQRESAPNHA